ncbi:helix-turn-helix transcriptional regulator [Pseudoclavibacter sp. VKM Ac-2888]|uniref:helix-turn-helix transcriptional regulator n=1 Tax=Pseudoclavibacter sp. VKM Ac-2888 TaxID=2783830 RepID=UPI00188B4872|nr:helix-turn-helix domain-containing protein [Pseudoclavibacter sp. VKM Ac-2888]MBF4549206.1 helix-turn-helix domain-containing protein [Pseudoclavibacter sp. VKM Ac-2888]
MSETVKPVESTAGTLAATALLTLSEVAEALRKSEKQLRWMIHQGTAPKSALIGGRRMFRATDVEAFIVAAFEDAS